MVEELSTLLLLNKLKISIFKRYKWAEAEFTQDFIFPLPIFSCFLLLKDRVELTVSSRGEDITEYFPVS